MSDPGGYFDGRARAGLDHWNDAQSWYERRKRAVLLALLGRLAYDVAWEPACGGGLLTVELAGRCGRVHAGDASEAAVALAVTATADLDHVEVRRQLATDDPGLAPGTADLVVLSEFLYYLPADERRDTLAHVARVAAADGEVVIASWRHASHDTHGSGAEVTAEAAGILAGAGFRRTASYDDDEVVMLGLTRTDGAR